MKVTQYIKESCHIQDAKEPEDYIGMTMAWALINNLKDTDYDKLTTIDIFTMAFLIDPNNASGYRKIPVTFASSDHGEKPENIPRQMDHLIIVMSQLTPENFYQKFEEIHPFIDGNGRLGSILFNYVNGTLDTPIHPPEFIDKSIHF